MKNAALHLGLATLFTCLAATSANAHLGEKDKLVASDGQPGDAFGTSVSLDVTTAAVGAPFHTVGSTQGAAYIFEMNTPTNWVEMAKLTPTGAGRMDSFGAQLSLDGAYLAVSAPLANVNEGAVYIFNGSGATWTQTQVLTASDAASMHRFGRPPTSSGWWLEPGSKSRSSTSW